MKNVTSRRRPARSLRLVASAIVVTLSLAFTFSLAGSDASAQSQPKPASGRRTGPRKPPKVEPDDAKDGGVAPAAKDEARDGGAVVEARTTDGGTRVFRFGEVEVEGRLKSPQIVYFLRRVRAEFAASDLGHRTFMRELGETRNEPSF